MHFNYQHEDCLYTLLKYRFSGKMVIKSGPFSVKLQRAVQFNQHNRGVDGMPSTAKKRLLRKKCNNKLLSSLQKTKSTQPSGLVFADRNKRVKKTNIELEPIKNVDCYLYGHGK